MKTSCNKKNLRARLLSIVLVIGFFQLGMSQRSESKATETAPSIKLMTKHAIYLTPIKAMIWERANIGYEYMVSEKAAFIADVQVWFLDKRPREFLFSIFSERVVNKGGRFALGAKYYPTGKGKKHSLYMGASIFYGHHKILKTKDSYNLIFTSDPGSTGKINLTSQGLKLSLGFRKNFKGGGFMDVGIDLGRAWINKEKDTLTVISEDESEPTQEVEFDRLIRGAFKEPMLAFGYNF